MTITKDRAAIYLRISRDKEGEELGVKRQAEDCLKLARRLKLRVVNDPLAEDDRYRENDVGASTRSRKPRPKYKRLLEDARAGEFTTIIAYTSSRLTRRPLENEDLIALAERYGVKFVYVASPSFDLNTADGRNIARILAANDAAESERISERVSREAVQRASTGRFNGGTVPFGFVQLAKGGPLVVDPVQAELVREAARRVLAGQSMYGICEDWNRRGIKRKSTKRYPDGNRWMGQNLRIILRTPAVAGLTQHRTKEERRDKQPGRLVRAEWEPILDRETWERVGRVLRGPKHIFPAASGRYTGSRPLSGIVKCGGTFKDGRPCGHSMIYQGLNGRLRLVCQAQASKGCGSMAIVAEPLTDWVLDALFDSIDSPRFQRHLVRRSNRPDPAYGELSEELVRLDGQLSRLGDAVVLGTITQADGKARADKLRADRVKVEERMSTLLATSTEEPDANSTDARARWESLKDPLSQRRFIARYISEVVISPFPADLPHSIRRRTSETQEDFEARHADHVEEVLERRVAVRFRV